MHHFVGKRQVLNSVLGSGPNRLAIHIVGDPELSGRFEVKDWCEENGIDYNFGLTDNDLLKTNDQVP